MTEEARPRHDYDADELGPFMARMLAALVRRAERGEIDALTQLHALERRVGSAVVDAARGANEGPGKYSWGEIGRWLGMTRQAAHQRFRRRDDAARG